MKESKRPLQHTSVTKAHPSPAPADRSIAPTTTEKGTTSTDGPGLKVRPTADPQARAALPRELEDQIVSKYLANTMDRAVDAAIGRLTFGIAPVASAMDVLDWLGHLAVSPGKQARLFEKVVRKAGRF